MDTQDQVDEPSPAMRGRLHDVRRVKDYVLAGNAHVTIRSKATGKRFTYRVNAPRYNTEWERQAWARKPLWFVSLLTGNDNNHDYKYVGLVRDTLEFHWGHKSKIGKTAPGIQAFYWFWNGVVRPENELRLQHLEVWHEGRCGRCGRRLTVPESVESGYGPECVHLVYGAARRAAPAPAQPVQQTLLPEPHDDEPVRAIDPGLIKSQLRKEQ